MLVASILGQSLMAVMAEALGTIGPAGEVDGRMVFRLAYPPHAVTTVGAYVFSVVLLTLHGLAVSLLFDEARGVDTAPAGSSAFIRVQVGTRLAQAATIAIVVAGTVSLLYKLQQHLS